jgi:hypothetical protein
MILSHLQAMLARLYDAPVAHDVRDYLITDRKRLRELTGLAAHDTHDEQVILVEDESGVRVGVFIDESVIARLMARDPLRALDESNLSEYCTALEGVSHFHYLIWSLERGRDVSMLELEVQADVDKYVSALALITEQRDGEFPGDLHTRLFHRVRFMAQADAAVLSRYEEANRHAARFCRALDERFLRRRRAQPEAWLGELRKFFRLGHQAKLRLLTT